MNRQDLQWWAGAIASALLGGVSVVALPHPWDKWILAFAAACGAFSAFRITPPDSQKKELSNG